MKTEAPNASWEKATIDAFVVKERRQRICDLLANPKMRGKLLQQLAHFRQMDPHFCSALPRGVHTPTEIVVYLKGLGAPNKAWLISEDAKLDQREMELEFVIEEILGRGIGTLVCCVPGKLAYFENEDGRWLLKR
jgi:hypothetical protein